MLHSHSVAKQDDDLIALVGFYVYLARNRNLPRGFAARFECRRIHSIIFVSCSDVSPPDCVLPYLDNYVDLVLFFCLYLATYLVLRI